MKTAIVVGTGAGGATVAKELQGVFDVTILERGGVFKPFTMDVATVQKIKRSGLMFDEREISFLYPTMDVRKTPENMVLVRGIGLGGTTTLATGNGLRMDGVLSSIGIDLDAEYDELEKEIPISTDHQRRWRKTTRRLFEICEELQLCPRPLPKMGDNRKCINCGRCVLGCEQGAKWDSRQFLNIALERGATLLTERTVDHVVIREDEAIGVSARKGWKSEFYPADLIVLAAGGLGTPVILQNSGIECDDTLFVDPVLCIAAEWKGCQQNREISMPFAVQQEGYILSPYFDYLSYFFRKDWKCAPEDTLGIMIKLADTNRGSITRKSIDKDLTTEDRERLNKGIAVCYEIFERLGVKKSGLAFGTLNAGHPGGMLPLTAREAASLHSPRLPRSLFLADASLLPSSLGNPPIFTIMAMAKRVSKVCKEMA